MPSPSKKPRLHLRSRARDDALLNRLLSEVRSHEKKVREELRRADETIADMRKELDQERGYTSRVKKEREQARVKLDDALADLDAARHDLAEEQNARVGNETAHRRTISELEAAVADALRKKNRERIVRDATVKKKVTMDLHREAEKTFKALLEKCDHIFQASGMQFDVDASSSEDEGGDPLPLPRDVAHLGRLSMSSLLRAPRRSPTSRRPSRRLLLRLRIPRPQPVNRNSCCASMF